MDKHVRILRKEELLREHGGWFDEENAERVVSWLVAAEDRRPVVLVGAGFTRNAIDKLTGKCASKKQAPLWHQVVEQLAGDIDVPANMYDGPTLFEMYREMEGGAKLRDALRATVADAELEPGGAHKALAAYPSEAIITTNCLDTLLDQACTSGWRRIVEDPDLSSLGRRSRQHEGGERDLIYLHGHRDFSGSWVMTRSQYEAFSGEKPVMLARVRQLLAQHPLLVVGFGMTDPNFHAVTRLLGIEMRGHQPLSLALMCTSPRAAEKYHWRNLGFELANPELDRVKERGLGGFFSWVFPNLVTSYSPTTDAAKAYILRGKSASEKLRRFREAYLTPIVDHEAAYRDWWGQLAALLSPEEQTEASKLAQEATRKLFDERSKRTRIDGGQPQDVPPVPISQLSDPLFEGLDLVPHFKPLAGSKEIRWLVCLRQKDATFAAELAEHFAWGLRHGVFEKRSDELAMEVLAVRMAKLAGWNNAAEDRFKDLIRMALSSAQKYRRDEVEKLLSQDVEKFEVEFSPEGVRAIEPHLDPAESAYRAYMNAEFEVAAEKYQVAARLASAAGLIFEEWIYTVGQTDAIIRLESPNIRGTKSRKHGDDWPYGFDSEGLRNELQRLRRTPTVEQWVGRADIQARSVLSEVLTRWKERERFRTSGNWGRRFGGGGHSPFGL